MKLSFESQGPGGLVKVNDGVLSFKIVKVNNNVIELLANESGTIISGKGINFNISPSNFI